MEATNPMSFTKALSKWISGLRYESVPEEAVPWVKTAVLDYFAVALAGCKAEGLQIVRRYVDSQYAKGDATIIGERERMSLEAAALYNGTAGRRRRVRRERPTLERGDRLGVHP